MFEKSFGLGLEGLRGKLGDGRSGEFAEGLGDRFVGGIVGFGELGGGDWLDWTGLKRLTIGRFFEAVLHRIVDRFFERILLEPGHGTLRSGGLEERLERETEISVSDSVGDTRIGLANGGPIGFRSVSLFTGHHGKS